MSGPVRALEAELSGEIQRQNNVPSVEAGRDVTTDLTPWQKQALGYEEQLAIRSSFKRRHPLRTLSVYNQGLFNGRNPRFKWEEAIERESDRTMLPEVYKRANEPMIANQLGLVETADKNFKKSRARFQAINPVGM